MPKMHIEKSILIDAPPEKVFEVISDFHSWPSWSPWLISEPDAHVDIRDDGKYYAWEGNRVGSGHMSVIREDGPESVSYDLTFLKPWKSSLKVAFHCIVENGGTRATWTMDSSLPVFMFWMKKSMEAFVGSDYMRGLAMLKEYIEKGRISSRLEFLGIHHYPGCIYIGIQRNTTSDKVGPDMEADIKKLRDFISNHADLIDGLTFSIYHKWDMVKGRVAYTSGIPVKSIPAELPQGMISGAIPSTRIYTLRHTGAYQHLGNAWTTLYAMQRNKEIRPARGIHPFETYENMPGEVTDDQLITDIHFPVK